MNSLPQGTSSNVRLLPGPPAVVLKRYRSARARTQARDALQSWAPSLTRLRAPIVLPSAANDPSPSLRLEFLEGGVLSNEAMWREQLDIAEALGNGLAELHALHAPPDPLPLHEAIPRRLAGWLKRDEGALGAERILELQAHLDPTPLRGLERVPCHRDLGPDNVVLLKQGGFGLIDWEHARADCAWSDILRTWEGLPPELDTWSAALARGAGLPLDGWPALRALGLVEGAGCIVWGTSQAQPWLVERGERLLRNLLCRDDV